MIVALYMHRPSLTSSIVYSFGCLSIRRTSSYCKVSRAGKPRWMKGLKGETCKELLRSFDLFSLRKRRLRVSSLEPSRGTVAGAGADLLSLVTSGRTQGNRMKLRGSSYVTLGKGSLRGRSATGTGSPWHQVCQSSRSV